jgi:hypothetical protein
VTARSQRDAGVAADVTGTTADQNAHATSGTLDHGDTDSPRTRMTGPQRFSRE